MDKEKLDRANFLQKEIRKIDNIIKEIYNNSDMRIVSSITTWYISETLYKDSLHKDEFVNMLYKWRDEYKKEFEEL